MTRSTVRTAVQEFIADAFIENLNQVLASFPKIVDISQSATAGQYSPAFGIVFIAGENESRVAGGGIAGGWKRVDYQVQFIVQMLSMRESAEVAMNDHDTLIDAIKARLRDGEHRLGLEGGTIVWQAGEPEIAVDYQVPTTFDDGATEFKTAISFIVTEMIEA